MAKKLKQSSLTRSYSANFRYKQKMNDNHLKKKRCPHL